MIDWRPSATNWSRESEPTCIRHADFILTGTDAITVPQNGTRQYFFDISPANIGLAQLKTFLSRSAVSTMLQRDIGI